MLTGKKSYSISAKGVEGMAPGTKVKVIGEGVVQQNGTILVGSFRTEGGPNSADVAMRGMVGKSRGIGAMEGTEGMGEDD